MKEFLTQVLDQFLVLVKLLQSFNIHEWDVVGLGLITMLLVSQNTDLHVGARDMLEPGEDVPISYTN